MGTSRALDVQTGTAGARNPSVTVLIPTYNGARFLREAIDSALGQTWEDLEVLVVDDGSTDETPSLLASYGTRIRSIRKPNGGTSSALNVGLRAARGEWIAWLDSDNMWEPTKIERQMEAARTHPAASLIYTDYLRVDEAGRAMGRAGGPFPPGRATRILRILRRMYINSNSTLIRKSVFDQVGLFDETEPTAHDLDMFLRILERYEIAHVPEPLLKYRVHPGQLTKKPFTPDRAVARALRRLGGVPGAAGVAQHLALKVFYFPMYVQKESHPEKRSFRALLSSFPGFLRLVIQSPS